MSHIILEPDRETLGWQGATRIVLIGAIALGVVGIVGLAILAVWVTKL